MKEVNQLFLNSEIDWTNFKINFDIGGYAPSRPNFDLFANDFLNFARNDFIEKTDRGTINAISNIKRAIDCKIDEVLSIFDIDIKIKQNKETINGFLKNFDRTDKSNTKLDLINALGFAPSSIVGKTRAIRNALEHKYKLPDKQSIEEGLEIANLFNDSLEGKVKIVEANIFISNYEHTDRSIHISFDVLDKAFKVSKVEPIKSRVIEIDPDKPVRTLKIRSNDSIYYYLIRLINHKNNEKELGKTINLILKKIGNTMPEEHIKFSVSSAH